MSSGAIALGLPYLGLDRRPRSVPKLQAASALGQARLQQAWERALTREGLLAAQVLLTASDVADRGAYVNARNALHALFALGAVPVVNENDTTATDEIAFGDNDALAAHVAILVRARLLVLLTEVEGVFTRAPGTPGAELVGEGAEVAEAVLGDASRLGRGGMRSKVLAAQMAAAAGIPTVIAGGAGEAVLEPILAGEPRGTRFQGSGRELSAYQLWLRFGKARRWDAPRRRRGTPCGRRRTVAASWRSASSPARAASRRAMRSSSSARTGSRSRRGSPGADAAEIAARRRGSRRSIETASSSTESRE